MRLYLIRHPKPLVPTGVCYGSSDVGVDSQAIDDVMRGLDASASSAGVLATAGLPRGLDIYSSPLQRCTGLARRVAESFDCSLPVFDERLVEMHFGRWELREWDDIPRCEVDAWAGDTTMYRPGGGESVMDMARRVQAFYVDVLLKRRDAIVVCHAGTIRMLLACQGNEALGDIALGAVGCTVDIGYGNLVVVDCGVK
jgi:alpha-ribazole phosphatase